MSDQGARDYDDSADPAAHRADPAEPIDCEVCGEPLEFGAGETVFDEQSWAEGGPAAVVGIEQWCSNENCPTRGADLAPAAEHQSVRMTRSAEEGAGFDGG